MNTQTTQSESFLIPLNLLIASPRNVRKTGGKNVDDLAASIRSVGLLQNLTVAIKGKKYEVLAGGRRLLALQQLHKARLIACDHEVRCEVRAADDATEISTAENELREAMHPADQFDAFKAMADAGNGIEDIAAKFSVSTLVVRQRMKLASVAPSLLKLYRDGKATLEQMAALALTDDQAEQVRVWKAGKEDWCRSPSRLREALTTNEVPASNKLAKLIGLEAYEQAGGAVRRDLFGGDTDCFIADAALLTQLADAAIQSKVLKVKKEGWREVEYREQWEWNESEKYRRLANAFREPTKAETATLDALAVQIHTLLNDGDGKARTTAKIATLRKQSTALRASFKVKLTAETKALALSVVHVDRNGVMQVERGLVTPAQFKALTTTGSTAKDGKIVTAEGTSVSVESATLSAALEQRLTEQRTMALRALWITNPRTALVETVHALAMANIYEDRFGPSSRSVLTVSASNSAHFTSDLTDTAAGRMIVEATDAVRAMLPKEPEQLRAWLNSDAVTIETLMQIQAVCTAESIDAVQAHTKGNNRNGAALSAADPIAKALGLNMADFFETTAETYLGSVSKAQIVAAVTEAKGAEAAAPLEKMKKSEAAAAAETLLQGSRWVPALIR